MTTALDSPPVVRGKNAEVQSHIDFNILVQKCFGEFLSH